MPPSRSQRPLIIGIAGPSGSGKSLLAVALREALGPDQCAVLPIDSYYRDRSHLPASERADFNFDDPSALDPVRIVAELSRLRKGSPAACPGYDFTTHTSSPVAKVIFPAPILIVEGIFALALPELQGALDRLWYIDLPAEACLARRLVRDVQERGRNNAEVHARFERFVRPSMARHVLPQKERADTVFDGALAHETLVQQAIHALQLPEPPGLKTLKDARLPERFARLAARVGLETLGRRLEKQASHWAGLHHQGEGLLQVERYIPLDRLLGRAFEWSGLARIGRRAAAHPILVKNNIYCPRLPTELEGFTLLQLSDLHLDLDTGILPELCERLPTLDYDLAVITGDYRNRTASNFQECLHLTGQLLRHIKQPVFGILGNHDFIEMVDGLEAHGLRILLNESVFIERGEARIFLAGIDDPHFYRSHDFDRAGKIAASPECFRIVLSHSPETYREASEHFDLLLAGHTHGGQICLPGGIPIVRNGNCPARLLAGPWSHRGLQGYTSRGTGCCGLPIRLFCPPEITLHTLTGKP